MKKWQKIEINKLIDNNNQISQKFLKFKIKTN